MRSTCVPAGSMPWKKTRPCSFSHALAYPPPQPERPVYVPTVLPFSETVYSPWSLTWSP